MATRIGRLGWLAALAVTLGLGGAANAAVVCQKGNKIKLRSDACRGTETPVATLGGDDPTGIWRFTGGTLLGDDAFRPEFLVLNEDGSGRLNLSGGDGPVLSCAPLNHSSAGNGTLVLDDWGFVLETRVYRFALEGDDGLRLVDAVGHTASFDRATAVDADKECGSLVRGALFTGLPQPAQSSGLAFDGSELWYTESNYTDRIVSVDPATGSTGAPLTLSNAYVHAAQSADFWTHCNCGGSEEAFRVTRAGQLADEVKTPTELGEEISVEAIAFDAASGALWLHGWNDANQGRLMKVDAGGEPDVLLQAFDLDASITGMTFAGSSLCGLNVYGQSVVRIDPATGQVTGTFLIPDRSAYWRGIAAVGSQLFLLGDTGSEGALLSLEMPAN